MPTKSSGSKTAEVTAKTGVLDSPISKAQTESSLTRDHIEFNVIVFLFDHQNCLDALIVSGGRYNVCAPTHRRLSLTLLKTRN
jgi:hypothetical protein